MHPKSAMSTTNNIHTHSARLTPSFSICTGAPAGVTGHWRGRGAGLACDPCRRMPLYRDQGRPKLYTLAQNSVQTQASSGNLKLGQVRRNIPGWKIVWTVQGSNQTCHAASAPIHLVMMQTVLALAGRHPAHLPALPPPPPCGRHAARAARPWTGHGARAAVPPRPPRPAAAAAQLHRVRGGPDANHRNGR
eukprot:gene11343-biopygen19878